jgi:hydroxypyruvate reductase
MALPAEGVTLEEKQAVNKALLKSGANISEMNCVRKHLSAIKGGRLARAAAPARVVALMISDVPNDDLSVIASGPTAPDPTTYADALGVLETRRVVPPPAVAARLQSGARGEAPETPKPGDLVFDRVTNRVIGNNTLVVEAAVARARALGYEPHLLTRALQGEAREVARQFVARARTLAPPACLIAGGETTVTVRGRGRGGRCQEFALAAALELREDEELVVLAAGTDGTDGPTDAAGGVVDAATVARGRQAGSDPRVALDDNDAGTFLAKSNGLVVSGPTNTNLLDVYIAVRGHCSSNGRSALTR